MRYGERIAEEINLLVGAFLLKQEGIVTDKGKAHVVLSDTFCRKTKHSETFDNCYKPESNVSIFTRCLLSFF